MEYYSKKADRNKRLDVYIHLLDLGLSRAQAQKLIDSNNILVNEKPSSSNYRLKIDDKISITIPKPRELKTEAENIPLEIVYEDSDIIVVNKPRGMVVHPAAGNYSHTLVNALLAHCKDLSGIGGVLRPGIVHRLDKDTSGLIVVAKNDKAHESLSRQFKDHKITKIYLALVKGVVKEDSGKITEPIGRHPVNRKKMAVVPRDTGRVTRDAYTEYEVLQRFADSTLLKVKLGTGRTHQIRVHLSHIGHSVVGDPVYGKGSGKGQLLHSHILGFEHPATGKHMEFTAEMPEDMMKRIRI